MDLVEPDLELRNAIISHFWAKGGGERVSEFFFNFQIDSIYVYYIKNGEKYEKVIYVKPKFDKNRRKNTRNYHIRTCIGDLGIKSKLRLFKYGNEPFPGAWSNDNPFSRIKQKPNKGR